MIMVDGVPVAFIDFDDAAPGSRVDDFAYFLWTFLDLGEGAAPETQASKMRTLCDVYGFTDHSTVVNAVLAQQGRILAKRELLKAGATDGERARFQRCVRRKFVQKLIGFLRIEPFWRRLIRHAPGHDSRPRDAAQSRPSPSCSLGVWPTTTSSRAADGLGTETSCRPSRIVLTSPISRRRCSSR